jgi:tetratricopeptide (TPR) repeat protein
VTWPSRRALIAGTVVLGIVVVLAAGGTMLYLTTQRAAAAAYAEALAQVQGSRASTTPETQTAAARQLEATLARYPTARLAAEAAYELANLRFAERQYAAARNAYGIALARGTATVRTLARAGVGYTWEAEKDYAKAADAFQTALDATGPADFLFESLALDLGRTQELAGQRDRAIETYRRLLREAPKTPRVDEIRMRLASLGAAP